MPTPAHHDRLTRILAALGGGLAFVAAATMVQPDWSRADSPAIQSADISAGAPGPASRTEGPGRGLRRADDVDPDASRPPVSDLLPGTPLGMLEGPHGSIAIHATPHGPRYHVLGPDGRRLHGVGLTVEQLASRFPSLDLREAEAAVDGPSRESAGASAGPERLMLADPDAAWNH